MFMCLLKFQNTRIPEGLLNATVMQISLLTTTLPYWTNIIMSLLNNKCISNSSDRISQWRTEFTGNKGQVPGKEMTVLSEHRLDFNEQRNHTGPKPNTTEVNGMFSTDSSGLKSYFVFVNLPVSVRLKEQLSSTTDIVTFYNMRFAPFLQVGKKSITDNFRLHFQNNFLGWHSVSSPCAKHPCEENAVKCYREITDLSTDHLEVSCWQHILFSSLLTVVIMCYSTGICNWWKVLGQINILEQRCSTDDDLHKTFSFTLKELIPYLYDIFLFAIELWKPLLKYMRDLIIKEVC